jgi:hypothetical protein
MEKAKAFSNKVFKACWDWFNGRPADDLPPLLYHFTDAAGLAGILGDGILRASLVTSLNDCSEIQHGVDLATNLVLERKKIRPSPFLDAALRYLPDPTPPWLHPLESSTFVVSLCGRIDKSVHWLHYGQTGKGVAIGFDATSMAAPPFRLVKVEYGKQKQRELVEGLLGEVQQALGADTAALPGGCPSKDEIAGHIFSICVRALAAEFKSECFIEEEEWRLLWFQIRKDSVVQGTSRPKYRSVDGRVVPYVEAPLGPEQLRAVRQIVLGNTSPLGPNDPGLKILVQEASPEAEIIRSLVPVR